MTDTPATAAGARAQLDTLLVAGETLIGHALQHRFYCLWKRRQAAAATNTRFIRLVRPLLGGYQAFDIRWQDLKDARITVGMFTADLTISYNANRSDTAAGDGDVQTLQCRHLIIADAQALYRECQAQELAWREKRRVRTMEEMRASAGGVQIATGLYPPATPEDPPRLAGGSADDPVERLSRAKTMRDQGLITDAEYEAIKARVVGGL